MKSLLVSLGALSITAFHDVTTSKAFEVNPPEVISHSVLARLLFQTATRPTATRQKSGVAFVVTPTNTEPDNEIIEIIHDTEEKLDEA